MGQGDLRGVGRVGRFVSLTAFLTTLLVYSPNMMALHDADADELTRYFAEPLLLCTTLAALLIVAVPPLRRAVSSPRVHLASLGLYLASELAFAALLLAHPAWGGAAATGASVACALTLVPACVAWARCLGEVDLGHSLGIFALAFGVSALCNMALKALGFPAALLAYMALAVVGVLWPVVRLVRRAARGTLRSDDATGEAPAASEAPAPQATPPGTGAADGTLARARAFLSVMGVPLLGMAISSFAMGVQPAFLFGDTVDAQHLGMLVADALLVALSLAWARVARRPLFSFLYQVLLPAFVALALVLCAFPIATPVHEVGLAALYVFYSMVSCVGVAVAVATANAGEFSRASMVAALVSTFCGAGILGIFLGARVVDLIDNNTIVLLILSTAYGCWLLLSGCLKSWRLMVSAGDGAGWPVASHGDVAGTSRSGRLAWGGTGTTSGPVGATSRWRAAPGADGVGEASGQPAGDASGGRDDAPAESLDERIARLAASAGLSPRETEVLGFVGRGHSSVFVAKTLLVSESTVYTHVRNLYRKLGVSTREELIQLVNDRTTSGGHASDAS